MMDPEKATTAWFRKRKWKIFDFQREVWEAYRARESGLVHCTTGAGKTYAVWFAALREAIREDDAGGGLRVLWITPLRALAADTEAALVAPIADMRTSWRVGRRTGDTSSHQRKKILERPPEALVTTPESLSLLLSQPEFLPHFRSLRLVVVDEWHELLSSKRGVLAELSLARLRTLSPEARYWGLSATLGNTEEATRTLGGYHANGTLRPMRIVTGGQIREVDIQALLPPVTDHYPWGGHLGLQLLPSVVTVIKKNKSSIIFTNTRSQAELWHRGLVEAMPEWKDQIGLHHGSLDQDVCTDAEEGLRTGRLRAVVATSSLDLGVDFAPVDAVLQVGSPKGVARLLQRAGRSGHQLELSLAGETLHATADRVLLWPAERTLFLADLHLGKDAAFRSAGSWVPPGTTASDLARLSRALVELDTQRLVILGDVFHSEHARESATMTEVLRWRTRHSDLEIILIAGNHDRHATQLADEYGFLLEKAPRPLGPWTLCHYPAEVAGSYVLCGHVHPQIRLQSPARESLRLPCFLAGPTRCILPAFSEFTGGAMVKPSRYERVIAVAGDEVVAVLSAP